MGKKPSGSAKDKKSKSGVVYRQHTKRPAHNRMGHAGYPPLLDTPKRHSDAIPMMYIGKKPIYPMKRVKYPDCTSV